MISNPTKILTSRRVAPRRPLAALCTVVYLVAIFLHAFYHIDVAGQMPPVGSGSSIVAAISDVPGDDTSDKAVLVDHHCHGCFFVSIDAPASLPVPFDLPQSLAAITSIDHAGVKPGLDTPPPKSVS